MKTCLASVAIALSNLSVPSYAAPISIAGPDMFMAESWYDDTGRLQLQRANEFCSGRVRTGTLVAVVATLIQDADQDYARVYFKCLDPGSAEYLAKKSQNEKGGR